MSPQYWHLRTEHEVAMFNQHVSMLRLAGKPARVQFVEDDRTTDQNTMAFALYRQIAAQINDQSVNDIRGECKLVIGVGLLRASDEGFNQFYASGLKHLTYEQKLAAMAYVPITSLMGKKVFSEYLDEIIRKYSQRGISLTRPGEEQ